MCYHNIRDVKMTDIGLSSGVAFDYTGNDVKPSKQVPTHRPGKYHAFRAEDITSTNTSNSAIFVSHDYITCIVKKS